jgi:Leucine-rich repeat (LRR) protein
MRRCLWVLLGLTFLLLAGCPGQRQAGKTIPGSGNTEKEPHRQTTPTTKIDPDQEQAAANIMKLGGKVVFGETQGVTKVDLNSTSATDADLVLLKAFTNLEALDLGKTKITDAGLEHCQGLTKLRSLNLAFTKVTDTGLVSLKGLTNLQTVYLQFTDVTDKGVEELKKALPKLTVSR